MTPVAIDYRGDDRPRRRLPAIVVWPTRLAAPAFVAAVVLLLLLTEHRLLPRHLVCCLHPRATVAAGAAASLASVLGGAIDAWHCRGGRRRLAVAAAVLAAMVAPLAYGFVRLMQA